MIVKLLCLVIAFYAVVTKLQPISICEKQQIDEAIKLFDNSNLLDAKTIHKYAEWINLKIDKV